MRDITLCHPQLQVLAAKLVEECSKQGLSIKIGETFQTVEEQDARYAQGRTTPGNIVTNARGSSYSPYHQWGTAFDFYRADGKGAYYDSDGFFTKVGKIHTNKIRFVEGKHYIALVGNELKEFKNKVRIPHPVENEKENEVRIPHSAEIKAKYQFDTQFKYAKSLYLWTEKGALLHAKSLNTDKAWEVYDYLVDMLKGISFYFHLDKVARYNI